MRRIQCALEMGHRVESAMREVEWDAGFERVYAEHAGSVYRFAYRLTGKREDAEDLAAEALAEAFRTWSRFRGDASVRTWIYGILLNRWRTQRRKRQVRVQHLDTALNEAAPDEPRDFELERAIANLPPKLREAFLLVKSEGFPHAEAARLQGVPVGTVSFRVHRAIQLLRAELEPSSGKPMKRIEVACDQEM